MNIRHLALPALLLTACAELGSDAPLTADDHALEAARPGVLYERVSSSDLGGDWSRFLAEIPELADPRSQVGAMAGDDVLFVGINGTQGSVVYRSDQAAPVARFRDGWIDAIAVGDLDGNGTDEAYFGVDTPLGVTVRRSHRGLDAGVALARPDARRAIRGLAIGDTDGDGRDELVVAFATPDGGALGVSDGRSLVGYVWGPHGSVAIDSLALRSTGRDLGDELFLGVRTARGAELWRGSLARPNAARVAGPELGAAYTALGVAASRGGDALYVARSTADGSEISRSITGDAGARIDGGRRAATVVAIAAGRELLLAFDANPGCAVGINPEPKIHEGVGINPEPKDHACINPEPKAPEGVNPEPKVHLFGINPEPKFHN